MEKAFPALISLFYGKLVLLLEAAVAAEVENSSPPMLIPRCCTIISQSVAILTPHIA
jgi:hypothetical protein